MAILELKFSNRRFAHFFPNLLKSLDPSFAKSVVGSFQFIEYKGLIEMAEPRVITQLLWRMLKFWKPEKEQSDTVTT